MNQICTSFLFLAVVELLFPGCGKVWFPGCGKEFAAWL